MAIKQLELEWEELLGYLRQFAEFSPDKFVPWKTPLKDKTGNVVPNWQATKLDQWLKGFDSYSGGAKGAHFFKVEYTPGEIIMPKGTHSDFAALLLQGEIAVYPHLTMDPPPQRKSCWTDPGPWTRRVGNWILRWSHRFDEAKEKQQREELNKASGVIAKVKRSVRPVGVWLSRGIARMLHRRWWLEPFERQLSNPYHTEMARPRGEPAGLITAGMPFLNRFLGLTSALWNLPRSVTLVAGPSKDAPCQLLLIKRKVINDKIIKDCPAVVAKAVDSFLRLELPAILARNKLFRDSVYSADIKPEAWPELIRLLQGRTSLLPALVVRIRDNAKKDFLDKLDKWNPQDFAPAPAGAEAANGSENVKLNAARYQVVKALNRLLQDKDAYPKSRWSPDLQDDSVDEGDEQSVVAAKQRWSRIFAGQETPTENEVIWLNRPAFDADFKDFLIERGSHALTHDRFRAFVKELLAKLTDTDDPLLPVDVDIGTSGYQITPAGRLVDNYKQGSPSDALYLILNGNFMVSKETVVGKVVLNHLQRDGFFGESCVDPNPIRSASVEALTDGRLLKIPRQKLLDVLANANHEAVKVKMGRERARMLQRDLEKENMQRLPPTEPPAHLATGMLRAKNILLIDMDLCTRCDQCVRSCAEAHHDNPRFHRANPEWRFGKWEMAGACVHCIDAPCQKACPVGAITLLDSGAVQIHRDRCIGCELCYRACPFGVIDMYPATNPEEKKALPPNKANLATKCDLCLTPNSEPPCVAGCPYGAAERGDPRTLFPAIKGWATFGEEV